MLTREKL